MKALPWILFVLTFFTLGFVAQQQREAAREAQISANNLQAALDHTRRVLGDQATAATRLAAQRTIERDELGELLDEALEQRDASVVALQEMEFSFDSLTRVRQTPVVDTVVVEGSDTVRVATFTQEGPPIAGVQTVRVGLGITLDSRLAVSPFTIRVGVACSGTAPVFSWEAPNWVDATYRTGAVAPEVCYPQSGGSLFEISTGKSIWAGLAFGLGVVVGRGL